MPPRNPNVEPKPFVWVPIPESERPQRREPTTHERFVGLTGVLEFTFTVKSAYLFVGSGAYEFDPNARGDRPDVWYTFYRRNGELCIPGTSLKGAIRSIVEAITNSCVSQYRPHKRERVDRGHEPCRFKEDRRELCPACRLFGVTGLRGRVCFDDAVPQGTEKPEIIKIAELWEPCRPQGRKFYEFKQVVRWDRRPQKNFRFVEAMPQGATFQGTLRFENLSQGELGLLCLAMGMSPHPQEQFTPKIGGAKPRCLGAVTFTAHSVRLWGTGGLQSLRSPQTITGLSACLADYRKSCDAENLLHPASWKQFLQGMRPKSETCPREVY